MSVDATRRLLAADRVVERPLGRRRRPTATETPEQATARIARVIAADPVLAAWLRHREGRAIAEAATAAHAAGLVDDAGVDALRGYADRVRRGEA